MNNSPAETRARLAAAGMGADDLRWLDSIGWSDAAVPPARAGEIGGRRRGLSPPRGEAQRRRRRARLRRAGQSPEGKLAAALGARLADARDGDDDEE